MIVLDTNVVSEVLKPTPDPRVVAWLESLAEDVAITSITMAELFAGLRRLPDGKRKTEITARVEAAVQPYVDADEILGFDVAAASSYADIVATRERAGRPIATADAQIAAICVATGAACATRNVEDFADCGVALINPWTGELLPQ